MKNLETGNIKSVDIKSVVLTSISKQFRYEKVQSELRRLEEAEAYNRDTRKIKEENERLRDRLEKTMNELDTLRNTIQFDQESFEKLKERIGQRENDAQSLEAKLHEATLQLERSRSEIAKLISNQVRES